METKMINLKIDNIPVTVPQGTTILEAAKVAGIKIPTLCYLKETNQIGACRICVVEVKGARTLVASCVYPVGEGMEVFTSTPRVLKSRKTTVELILSDHKKECLSCVRSGNCELQDLSNEFGCDENKFSGETSNYPVDNSTAFIVRDNAKCVLCRRCVAVCKNVQSIAAIGANARGFDTHIGCAFEQNLADVTCVGCGQCVSVCPTGALREKDEIDNVLDALNNPNKYVIVATAPAVRVALGEEFGNAIGTNVEGKMVTALRRLGFKEVFDVNFAADLTIMEEGHEFLDRFTNNKTLPMITSCSPAWIKFCEHYYPDLLPNLSTCKSPQQMFGSVAKTYYCQKLGIDPKDMYVVSIMPCTAKKFEKGRANQSAAGNGIPDIDAVLTTRELARLIKRKGILFNNLPDGKFDTPFGIASSAGLLFGATGGVMEAALRTVTEIVEGKTMDKLDYEEVRGLEGIKEATYNIAGNEIKVAVASGLANARKLMDLIREGKADYHFIEIMSCPGGCVNGGGQPIQNAFVHSNVNVASERAKAIRNADKNTALRKSHENPAIQELYKDFFGEPNSHKAHEILHTQYEARK